ncbi:spermidine synthase [Pedomonas sp. V897]|uniref:spermidine synthase n=1 Tax=Pedomonas sp. V897 TaxID=3446482 RepID=UPI003EDE885E
MKPRILLATAPLPDGGQLQLFKRDTEFSITLGNIELMNSRLSKSEEALATLACEKLAGLPAPRILIGGLGMGFTLRAALRTLGPRARIDVAELVPEVVAWAGGPLADLFGNSLSDPRLSLAVADVAEFIQPGAGYDAILLDVDNGPEGLVQDANNALYQRRGLLDARDALKPGGILAVWSITPDSPFTNRLKRAGFAVEEQVIRAHGTRHVVWLATKARG